MIRDDRLYGAARSSRFGVALTSTFVAGVLLMIVGCSGGAISERDMARFSLPNPPEEEEERAAPAAAPKPVERVAAVERRPTPAAAQQQQAPAATAPTQEQSEPPATSEALTDTESPPKDPLSPEERTKRSVANIQRIAAAFQKHLDEKGYYPARAIYNGDDQNLSWRVTLLPYLGYQRLYDEFRLDEPWNSRHNYTLLKKIPSVYQSPERFDDHTNYVVPAGSSTVFRGKGVVRTTNFEDGAKNTAMVVEVDDVGAVPWTAPREYELDVRSPTKNLGGLRGGSFFLVWGNAEVGRVLASSPQDKLRAMFTHDAGEDFSSGQIDQPLFAAPQRVARATTSTAAAASAPTPAAPTVVTNTSALAQEYAQQSSEALARSDEQLGACYYYAAALAGPPGQAWVQQFKWVPALRRPAAVIRVGIGLQYSGPQESKFSNDDRPAARSRAWTTVTGELGQQLVEVIARHVSSQGNSSLLSQDPKLAKRSATAARRGAGRSLDPSGLFAPGVEYLAQARESAIRKLAEREGIDLVMIVDWRETARGWSAGLSLVDVIRGAEVWKAPRILSAKIDRAKSNPLAANPLDDTLRDLAQFLETDCVFREIPEKLQRRHAAARIAALAAEPDSDPLRAMVEMRLYQELGLVDATQLVKAYQEMLGEDAGLQLVLGSDDAKRQIFKSLMPAVPLMANNRPQIGRGNSDEE